MSITTHLASFHNYEADATGSNLEVKETTNGWTPLIASAREGHTAAVELLVEAGQQTISHQILPLQSVITSEYSVSWGVMVCILAIASTISISTGCCFMHNAHWLLTGAKLDSKYDGGETALSDAAFFGHLNIAQLLIKAGQFDCSMIHTA